VEKTTGIVLNVGANEDPANLKAVDPERVINCDIEAQDSYLNRPNKVDVLFDCTKKPWPFRDDYAQLVVFGDIIEHLYPKEARAALEEAHRVADKICITVPRDKRWEKEGVEKSESGYRTHCYEWHQQNLSDLLQDTGWEIVFWQTTDYFFVPEGYFVLADRVEPGTF